MNKSWFYDTYGKISSKLARWKAHALSQVGKTIFVKSNLAGVPLLTMQGIKSPNYIAKKIDNANRDIF